MTAAAPRRLALLGATGSVGTQALDVVRAHPDRFVITGLSAGGGRPELLAAQAAEFGVATVAVADPAGAGEVREMVGGAARGARGPARGGGGGGPGGAAGPSPPAPAGRSAGGRPAAPAGVRGEDGPAPRPGRWGRW